MSTSGTVTFQQTVQQLIYDAFQIIGVYGNGLTISAADMTFAISILNKMVKAWGSQGLHLWEKDQGVLFTTPNVQEYSLGPNSSDAMCAAYSNTIITQVTAAAALNATQIYINNTAGMVIGSNIGIYLDGGSVFWTTIQTVNSNNVILTSGITSTSAASNNVYYFTTKINKPLRILQAKRLSGVDTGNNNSTVTEIWMTPMSYQEYFNMSNRTISGTPIAYMYDPQLTDGQMYLWQRPSDSSYRIQFTYERMIQDLNTVSNNFDFPNEWLEALTFQLAVRLASAFGKDQKLVNSVLPIASKMLEDLKAWDTEIVSVKFQPDIPYGGY